MNKLNLTKIIIPNKYNIYFKAFHLLIMFIITSKFINLDYKIISVDNKFGTECHYFLNNSSIYLIINNFQYY